jgi:hypothetical protein
MKKMALFVFNGDPMCFVHVLLNALDMNRKGHQVKIVVEGQAVKLIGDIAAGDSPWLDLFRKARENDLVAGVCRACSAKFAVTKAVEREGLPLLDDMSGHPSMTLYLDNGFDVITF